MATWRHAHEMMTLALLNLRQWWHERRRREWTISEQKRAAGWWS
ncbi:MAG TPA: hypothetical protein VKE42_05790 [Candidatus Cybelea sp.]|nr:hypothetical protein [Candidatus Cybelea sp.]